MFTPRQSVLLDRILHNELPDHASQHLKVTSRANPPVDVRRTVDRRLRNLRLRIAEVGTCRPSPIQYSTRLN